MNIPIITILVDQPKALTTELQKVYRTIMKKIRFEQSAKPSRAEKNAQGKIGFVVGKARWVIERSYSWMERYKSISKNCERTLDNATTQLKLRRLTRT